MDQPSTDLQRLQVRLQRINKTGIVDQKPVDIGNTVARLLHDALFDDQHPLSIQLDELENLVKELSELKLDSKNNSKSVRLATFVPEQVYFVPQPGNADPSLRKYWPLQLLLYIAACSPKYSQILAERLLITPEKMKTAAEKGANASTKMWSKEQYFHFLEQAVAALQADETTLPIRLDNRILILSTGKSFRLSQQSAKMLAIFMSRIGQAVRYSEFSTEGIQHAVQAKKRLLQQCETHGVELQIDNSPKAYCLRGVRIQVKGR